MPPETSSVISRGGFMDRVEAFGLAVRRLRRSKRMSQELLAEKADLHRNFVSLVERGQTKAALDSVFALADALEIRASELIQLAEELSGPARGKP